MAFEWKDFKDIFKGEGIYHLTWVVVNRVHLLGELEPFSIPDQNGHIAWTRATQLGRAVLRKVEELETRFEHLEVVSKVLMPDHIHVVVWLHEGFEGSVKMVARGFAQGCSKHAREQVLKGVSITASEAQSNCATDTNTPNADESNAYDPYDCGNGAHTLFETPFIRTLSRKGQLDRMIKYVKSNPDNAWMRKMHPDMYVIRRNQEHAGLHFDTMGKARLLDYPDRNVVALSRSLTDEQIETEVQKALRQAERGVVTYCAAINKGEKEVTKAIRSAGYPLVVMMLDGFPPAGSEAARFFHPGGAYHKICGEGRLYLMAPLAKNYEDVRVIERTDAELKRKAEAKGYQYEPLPHSSKRWRMIAGNEMMRMVCEG